jgi:hypothetical protein
MLGVESGSLPQAAAYLAESNLLLIEPVQLLL